MSAAAISTRRIADVLAEHGSAHARAYAPLLRTLKDSAVSGYLPGFLDLAFEHDGRWWLVDWKSNQLGPDDADYAPDRLSAAMHRMHYTLQYHLYLVALHRHLTVRQPGYDPATCWGGVAYVFLRGVTGTGDHGWFRDAPTPALLNALDAALGRRS
jgi:exodeoxyribonuclease V beta subunit